LVTFLYHSQAQGDIFVQEEAEVKLRNFLSGQKMLQYGAIAAGATSQGEVTKM
jgi:hypothetical protein